MKEPKDLINWVELSRYLAGNESSVSRTRCPKKYQPQVNALISAIEAWGKKKKKKQVLPSPWIKQLLWAMNYIQCYCKCSRN